MHLPGGCAEGGVRGGGGSGAVLESPAFVACLEDLAIVGEAIEQRRGHLGVAEGKVGDDDNEGSLVERADQVDQELATGLGEGQIAELVEHDQVNSAQLIGQASMPAGAALGLQLVHQVDDVEEAPPGTVANAGAVTCH